MRPQRTDEPMMYFVTTNCEETYGYIPRQLETN